MEYNNKPTLTELNQPTSSGMIYVKIYSPFNVYFDGEAKSVSAENDTGPFDVLYGHKKFLTLLSPGDLIVRRQGFEDLKFNIARGMMHVKGNSAVVYLDV